ncbi:biotin--[acetyl-CoA-carboxylase] ligase [Aequorivita marina]|uniref:biotin--[acetyl-CoA-carboxylase] ligase n=1 Tax=Aequorivita marina TaxID=3073654 RepID=UPI0028755467|nr:biotin--[acetyl-CoA-carboxylase] ligase [Aequorivita sp. S2608]MDS1298318.1 biotin--[acetyl-CoA-carboxylase] ligase [Aequorivita sp. S2608]
MNIIKLNATDSTNTYLKELAKETQLPDETVAITNHQTSGRGQMGNVWRSKKGQSLTFSMFKTLGAVPVDHQFMVAMATSLGVLDALNTLNIPSVSIKWPNDILSAKSKIGGILIENVIEGSSLKYTIVGIGLNVNESVFHDLPKASSLKMETGCEFNLAEVLQKITTQVFKKLNNLNQENFHDLKAAYEKNLFQKDAISVFEALDGSRFNGIIKGTSDIGALLVETENNGLRAFQLKEVRLIY